MNMKKLICSLGAIVAFAGAAFADHDRDTILERRFDAHGNTFFVHVRPSQETTTVALYHRGAGLGDTRFDAQRSESRRVVLNRRDDPHGRTVLEYGPEH